MEKMNGTFTSKTQLLHSTRKQLIAELQRLTKIESVRYTNSTLL